VGGGETETQNSKREIWRERLREKSEEMPVVVNTMRSGSHTHLVRFFQLKSSHIVFVFQSIRSS